MKSHAYVMIIMGEFRTGHFFFQPNVQFGRLNPKDQKQIHYFELYYHGLRYSKGNVEYKSLND